MFQLGIGLNSRILGQLPYWDMPAVNNLDIYFDATQNGYKNGTTYGTELANLVTDTHAQPVLSSNAGGTYSSFANNALVRNDNGIQTIPTRTNLVVNGSGTGAVTGTPGTIPNNWSMPIMSGVSVISVATGTVNGLPVVDIETGGTPPTTGGFTLTPHIGGVNSSPITPGAVYTFSVFLAMLAGIAPTTIRLSWYQAGGATSSTPLSDSNITLDGNLTRQTFTVTAPADAAFVMFGLRYGYTSGVATNTKLRIAAWQIELGTFATPPILTTNAALTVNGNQQTINGLASQLSQGVAGFIQIDTKTLSLGFDEYVLSITDSTTSNLISLRADSSNIWRAGVLSSSTSFSAGVNLEAASIGLSTFAFAIQNGFARFRRVGGSEVSLTPTSMPVVDRASFHTVGALNSNMFKYVKKFGLKYGPQNQASFDAMYAMAQRESMVAPTFNTVKVL